MSVLLILYRSALDLDRVYVFDTQEHRDLFRSSDLEKSIRETYRFAEPPTIRPLDVVQVLREENVPRVRA